MAFLAFTVKIHHCININSGERNMNKIVITTAVIGALAASATWRMAAGL